MTPIDITAGEDYIFKLVYKQSDGTIIDLSGASARMMVRRNHYTPPVITKTASIEGVSGTITFDFDPLDTSTLITSGPSLRLIYDVELLEASGDVTILSAGTFTVTQAVTRG